jgi:ribonuclease BN (tRNA processing enzyme)
VARAAGVGNLVLVHLSPLADACQPFDLATVHGIFPDIALGHDRDEFSF